MQESERRKHNIFGQAFVENFFFFFFNIPKQILLELCQRKAKHNITNIKIIYAIVLNFKLINDIVNFLLKTDLFLTGYEKDFIS